MSREPNDETPNIPWLAIAVGLVVLGIVVTVALGSVEPPPPPPQATLVEHEPVDLGDWSPFADTSVPGDAARDAGSAADVVETD